jgi:serine/threonine protein kinase
MNTLRNGWEDSELIRALGKYRIDGILGKGAMGIVYKAFDPQIERTVALKTITPKELFSDARRVESTERLKNEAQAGSRLNHPNIVTVFDYGEDCDVAYIAMEFVEGKSLAAILLPEKPMALSQVIAWMTDLLRALGFAHARGVIHRDIKPANLLITQSGQLKISDFGVARIDTSALSQIEAMAGTPSYMSPEQIRGEAIDGRSDLFSAGIVLYQLLTGARPFSGAVHEVMHQILDNIPTPPSQFLPSLGDAFDPVVAKALAKPAGSRYGSAQEFLDALTAACYSNGSAVSPTATADDDITVLSARTGEVTPWVCIVAEELHSADNTGSLNPMTPWLLAAMPGLEALLYDQIGPVAKTLLRSAAANAQDADALVETLLEHIPSLRGREQFRKSLTELRLR